MSECAKCATRLVLLPGLGADERLLVPQRTLNAPVEVPSWPVPEPAESLSSYAQRIAAQIQPGDDLFVGGVSFGGFVALEIARQIPVRGVILLASGRSFHAVSPALRLLARGARFVPSWVVTVGGHIPGVARFLFGARTENEVHLLRALLRDISVPFIRWAAEALLEWKPAPINVPILQIHGNRDRIIPASRVCADAVLMGAGHLLNVTDAAEVNRLIEHWLGGATFPPRQ